METDDTQLVAADTDAGDGSVDAHHVSVPVIDSQAQLSAIVAQLKGGTQPSATTVRTFLSWFGTKRRGYARVKAIRSALVASGLQTVPDFESAYIDSPITFSLAPASLSGSAAFPPMTATGTAVSTSTAVGEGIALQALVGGAGGDPTYRIGKLAAANNQPVSVKPESSLEEAVTLMLSNDFSQLPVMQSEYGVKGVVSWTSIGSRLALKQSGSKVQDFMDAAVIIGADTSLFAAIDTIVGTQYVLIRDVQNRITGIVTTSDLSVQFGQLGEPFLLLSEIENHVRRLIDTKFTIDEVKAACDPGDPTREVTSVADLTFGEYVRLLSKPERWSKLKISVDRAVFVRQLDHVREIRNDVMHFDPDGVDEADLDTLRKFGRFLAKLQDLGAT